MGEAQERRNPYKVSWRLRPHGARYLTTLGGGRPEWARSRRVADSGEV